jgi:ribosomal protein L37AE/L43A
VSVGGAPPAGPTPHAAPFFCPYCGEQDIRPADSEEAGTWECGLCNRIWKLQFKGLSN